MWRSSEGQREGEKEWGEITGERVREKEREGETSYLVHQTCSDPGLVAGNFKDLSGIECATLVSLAVTLCVTHIHIGTARGPV